MALSAQDAELPARRQLVPPSSPRAGAAGVPRVPCVLTARRVPGRRMGSVPYVARTHSCKASLQGTRGPRLALSGGQRPADLGGQACALPLPAPTAPRLPGAKMTRRGSGGGGPWREEGKALPSKGTSLPSVMRRPFLRGITLKVIRPL